MSSDLEDKSVCDEMIEKNEDVIDNVSPDEAESSGEDPEENKQDCIPDAFYDRMEGVTAENKEEYTLLHKYISAAMRSENTDDFHQVMDRIRDQSLVGFYNSYTRARVWPLLQGVGREDVDDDFSAVISQNSRFYDQLQKDIVRSCCHHDVHTQLSRSGVIDARQRLAHILHSLFHPGNTELHYIQGFHDVASIVSTVTNDLPLAFAITEKMAYTYLRDSLQPDISRVVSQMGLVQPLQGVVDEEQYTFQVEADVPSYFSLSWFQTWLSHTMQEINEVSRVFDFLLSSHPMMVVYLSASVVLVHKKEILQLQNEMPTIIQYLQQTSTAASTLISTACDLWLRMPPQLAFQEEHTNLLTNADNEALHKLRFPNDSAQWISHPVQVARKTIVRGLACTKEEPLPTRLGYDARQSKQVWGTVDGKPIRGRLPTKVTERVVLPSKALYYSLANYPYSILLYNHLHISNKLHAAIPYPLPARLLMILQLALASTALFPVTVALNCIRTVRKSFIISMPFSRRLLPVSKLHSQQDTLTRYLSKLLKDMMDLIYQREIAACTIPATASVQWNPTAKDSLKLPYTVVPAGFNEEVPLSPKAFRKPGFFEKAVTPTVLLSILVATVAVIYKRFA